MSVLLLNKKFFKDMKDKDLGKIVKQLLIESSYVEVVLKNYDEKIESGE